MDDKDLTSLSNSSGQRLSNELTETYVNSIDQTG